MITLAALSVGQKARIISVHQGTALRRRLLDMGLTPGTVVSVSSFAPFQDPMVILIRDSVLALRKEDAAFIEAEVIQDDCSPDWKSKLRKDNSF